MGQSQTDTGKFRAELDALPREEWPSTIRRLVSDQISLLLRRTIDPDRPLSDYGLDSLGNLELRTRIETETGVRISPTHITTVRGLAEHLCDQLADHGSCISSLLRAGCRRVDGQPEPKGVSLEGENIAGRAIGSRNAG